MNFRAAWRALRGLEHKASKTHPILVTYGVGQEKATPKDYAQFAQEGYQKSVIVYRCIEMISNNAAAVPWVLKSKRDRKEIEKHPLLDLLQRPNPLQGGAEFFKSVYAFYLISGNSYVENITARKLPKELWALRPDRVRVVPDAKGMPKSYTYKVGGRSVTFQVDPVTGLSNEILHVKSFHPLDDWYGMSAIEAASFSIDQHNEAGKWNARLLGNSARASGALIYKPDGDMPSTLTEQQRAALRSEIEQFSSGGNNAGRPMVLEGGLDWREMSLSPKDMDWLAGKDVSAREVALTFGVPPQLVGIDGSLTFANFEQARMALYDDAVLPLVDKIKDELNRWLCPMFGDDVTLEYDADDIQALEPRRKEKWESVKTADFLTINEKRAALGYDPIDSGDLLLVNAGAVPLETVFEGEDSAVEAAASAEEAYGDNSQE
jgi:HK97 family phage portal protein